MFNFAFEILGDLWYNKICIVYLSKGGRYAYAKHITITN